MTDRDQEEQDTGIDLMTISIEQIRADLLTQQARQLADQENQRKQARHAAWTIGIQLFAAFGTAAAGGAGLLAVILHLTGRL